jgi:hypothetical protein
MMKVAMPFLGAFVVAACAACLAVPASADDALNAIDQARKAYVAGNRAAASEYLESAMKLVLTSQQDELTSWLPDPLPGWRVDHTNNIGAVLVLRAYNNDSKSYKQGSLTLSSVISVGIESDPAKAASFIELSKNKQKAAADHKEFTVLGDLLIYRVLCPSDWCADTGDVHVIRIIDNKIIVLINSRPGATLVNEMVAFARAVRSR